MASLGYSEIFKVVACSPVTSHNQICLSVGKVLDPVDLAGLGPEFGTAVKGKSSQPVFLSLRAILCVKLASIDKDRALCSNEFLNIV